MGGKGKGGKGGPPPPRPAGGGKTKEELEAEKKTKREAEKAALEAKKVAEMAHIKFLEEIHTREAADISKPDWPNAKVQVLLAGGTSIVEMDEGKLVCIRRCPEPASELIADCVAKMLGIRTPKYRSVHPGDEEYRAIAAMTESTAAYLLDMPMTFENFVNDLKEANGGFIPTESRIPLVEKLEFTEPKKASKFLDCGEKPVGTIAVMEFLPAKGLDQCCGRLADGQLHSLGLIGALTALCNKHDCVCLPVWRESGNLTNMMQKEGDDTITAIDSHINAMKDAAECARYIQRLESLTSQLLKPDAPQTAIEGYNISPKSVTKDNLDLLRKGGFEVSEEDMGKVLDGLRNGLQKIATSWATGELKNALVKAEADAARIVSWKPDASSPEHLAGFVRSTAAAVAAAAIPDSSMPTLSRSIPTFSRYFRRGCCCP